MPIIIAKDQVREPLYAIVPVHNPWRWKSRIKHTERAIKHFMDSGAVVILVEAAFNRREFVFADSGLHGTAANCGIMGTDHNFRHQYVQLRTSDELWLKECLINAGAARIPDYKWQQVAWLDSDVQFVRPNWVGEAIHKLQHGMHSDIAFLQMFSHARDIGPDYEMLPESYPHADGVGFVQAWKNGQILSDESPIEADAKALRRSSDKLAKDVAPPAVAEQLRLDSISIDRDVEELERDIQRYPYPPRVFPGLAWAATREAWDAVGGLIDFAIWGGADYHMAHALIEKTEGMMRNDLHRNYKKLVMQWYYRCHTHVRRNVLVMSGSILHHWHGRKEGRGYNSKHALLSKVGFDPLRHLKRDSQGLYQLHDDRSTAFVQLRDLMRKIAKERDEDSSDTRLDLSTQGH